MIGLDRLLGFWIFVGWSQYKQVRIIYVHNLFSTEIERTFVKNKYYGN